MAEGSHLVIDSSNHMLAHTWLKNLTYTHVSFVWSDNLTIPLIIKYLAGLVTRKTTVHAKFVDSWYNPVNHEKDLARLQHILLNSSMDVEKVYGYFDGKGISRLPHSISELGLAIGDALDSEDISNLKSWPNLSSLRVSVGAHMPLDCLHPLPAMETIGICIPHLRTPSVSKVAPIICALVPQKRFDALYLPKCDLTYESACLLAEDLRREEILMDHAVVLENMGKSQITKEQRLQLTEKFPYTLREGGVVGEWNMSWIYD